MAIEPGRACQALLSEIRRPSDWSAWLSGPIPTEQRRRLYVRALPDPAFDASFARALIELGVPPVLEAATAPAVRRLLAVWDEARPPPFQRGK